MQQIPPQEAKKNMEDFLATHPTVAISREEICDLILNESSHGDLMSPRLQALAVAGIQPSQKHMTLAMACRNTLPHKTLGGKSPWEIVQNEK